MIRFRKVRLTEAGLEIRATTPVELLLSDGVVEGYGGSGSAVPSRSRKKPAATSATATRSTASKSTASRPAASKPTAAQTAGAKADATEPVKLTAAEEAVAARLRAWRAAEAKSLRVPAYVVLHDRTLIAVAQARPANPRQLLEISGMGPAKTERFGQAILELCAPAG